MKTEIVKEIKFGLRDHKFLILFVGFLFFAVLTPVMFKVVLPQVLKSQFPGITESQMSGMMDMSQLGTIRSYMGDVFEIGSIIVAFTLCGLMAQEIKDNTLVLPLCSGKRFGGIVGAKMFVFGAALVLAPSIALMVDYVYAGLLFSFDIGIIPIIRGGMLQGVYMVFLLANVMMWGVITKKPIATGFLTLIIAFGSYFVGSALGIQEYLPSGLLAEAQLLAASHSPSLFQTLLITGGLVLVFMTITIMRLKKMEWNER